jgi:hypothetical protein
MSSSPTCASPNNDTITTASSIATDAVIVASVLTDSQTTTVPGTELPPIPLPLPPFTDLSCSSSPSEASELYHPNGDADGHHESEDDNDDEEDDDMPGLFGTHNGDGDYTASQFSVQQCKMHFVGERINQQKNRVNVEICLLIEASTAVTNERAVTSEVQNQMMLDMYRNLVRMFSQDDFVSPSIQDNMYIKLFNGKSKHGDTGDKLWRKFEDWRENVRTEYMPKLPKEIADYPSGHSLRDVDKDCCGVLQG